MPSKRVFRAAGAGLVAAAVIVGGMQFAGAAAPGADPDSLTTKYPVKHVVVLFQENISFDHYFGTYPNAANKPGENRFTPLPGTPAVNGLTPALLTNNPNAGNPARNGPADVIPTISCDNNHAYSPEQKAYNGGLANKFVENTTGGGCAGTEVLNYYDGNTISAYWNYAQHFSMSDNHYGTGFGPSTVGAIELVSANTTTAVDEDGLPIADRPGTVENGTIYGNANPYPSFDGCSGGNNYSLGNVDRANANEDANTSKNIGDLLNAKNVSWGWFQAGFTPTNRQAPSAEFPILGKPICGAAHPNVSGAMQGDYDAHHNPFSYYRSTSNPEHLPPSAPIGETDEANHNYDTSYFDAAAAAGELPAVSFVKAPHAQDGHPGYSSPVDEQTWIADKVNKIMASPDWATTAIFIAYDDSDGWYDHQTPPMVRASHGPQDFLNGDGHCGPVAPTPGVDQTPSATNRCGFGPRLPLIAISPFAKPNHVDHTQTDQTSITRFIENNWLTDPVTLVTTRLGNNSVEANAGTLTNLFDFAGAGNTPKLTLDPATGFAPGAAVKVPADPTPAPAPGPAPVIVPPIPGPNLATIGAIKCTAKASTKKKVLVTCKPKTTSPKATAIRLRLLKGKKLVSTVSGTLKSGKKSVVITIKPKKALAKGKYTIGVSLAQVGATPAAMTVKLKI